MLNTHGDEKTKTLIKFHNQYFQNLTQIWPKTVNKPSTASTNGKHTVQKYQNFINNGLVLKNNLAYLSTITNIRLRNSMRTV